MAEEDDGRIRVLQSLRGKICKCGLYAFVFSPPLVVFLGQRSRRRRRRRGGRATGEGLPEGRGGVWRQRRTLVGPLPRCRLSMLPPPERCFGGLLSSTNMASHVKLGRISELCLSFIHFIYLFISGICHFGGVNTLELTGVWCLKLPRRAGS